MWGTNRYGPFMRSAVPWPYHAGHTITAAAVAIVWYEWPALASALIRNHKEVIYVYISSSRLGLTLVTYWCSSRSQWRSWVLEGWRVLSHNDAGHQGKCKVLMVLWIFKLTLWRAKARLDCLLRTTVAAERSLPHNFVPPLARYLPTRCTSGLQSPSNPLPAPLASKGFRFPMLCTKFYCGLPNMPIWAEIPLDYHCIRHNSSKQASNHAHALWIVFPQWISPATILWCPYDFISRYISTSVKLTAGLGRTSLEWADAYKSRRETVHSSLHVYEQL